MKKLKSIYDHQLPIEYAELSKKILATQWAGYDGIPEISSKDIAALPPIADVYYTINVDSEYMMYTLHFYTIN